MRTIQGTDAHIQSQAGEDSDIDDEKIRLRKANHVGNVVIKQEKDLDDDEYVDVMEENRETITVKPSGMKGKNRTPLEQVLKKNLELMTTNVKSKSRMSYLNIICKNLNKPNVQYANEEEEEASPVDIKTEDVIDGDEDVEIPVKKKRGRKPKSEAEKAAAKKAKKETAKGKKATPTKGSKDKLKEKRKVKLEATSGVEDQSGVDTDWEPGDFETSAGEDSEESDGEFDAFFDQTIDYKCRFCEDQFKSNDKLLRHYKAIHSQTLETSSLCPHCGYSTKSKAMLNRHIRRKHMNIVKEKVKQVCEICSAEVYHLAVHKRSLHAGLSFPCPYCGKTFPRKGELQFHIKGIHLKHQLESTKEAISAIVAKLDEDKRERERERLYWSPSHLNVGC
uniref:C2H2-type domain-containing protein n=1 Tax=Cacopsylla melanoneura TaxID=428564 RepID=A0A8D8Z208_9HEMI